MKPLNSRTDRSIIEKLKSLQGDAADIAADIAELEPDLDDPIVAERVRETLHRAATDSRRRVPRESNRD